MPIINLLIAGYEAVPEGGTRPKGGYRATREGTQCSSYLPIGIQIF